MKIKPVRGTHDILGKNIEKYNKIIEAVHNLAFAFDFRELQTPLIESTELFTKPLGEQSDVVLKEMYTFADRGGESLTLRPEYTTPMIRAAISNNLLNKLPCKIFGIGPMFRRERPQKGRYRQFSQINFETFGTSNSFADVELILLAYKILKLLLPHIKINLYLNSLGDRDSLKMYKFNLSEFFNNNKKHLSDESRTKIQTNPLRILDSKIPEDRKIIQKAPIILDFLNQESLKHYESIKKSLKDLEVKFYEDNSLVRGLDYYCHTVFEFKTESLGSQSTIIGGGRYDGLIENLGGKNIPGIGWAGGIERIILLMKDIEINSNLIHFAILDEKYKEYAFLAYNLLVDNNFSVFWNYKYNLKKSLSKANDENATHIIIIGENEFKEQKFTIKNLKNSEQHSVDFNSILNIIKC